MKHFWAKPENSVTMGRDRHRFPRVSVFTDQYLQRTPCVSTLTTRESFECEGSRAQTEPLRWWLN